MTLQEKNYMPRIIDKTIMRYMNIFGGLVIEGPKWCGKTWTALSHANSVVYLLNPENNYATREAALLNPASILEGTPPLLIDEWQEVPALWDAIRFNIDREKAKGNYLLTGSVAPNRANYYHSGVGRIARLRMRSMSLYESRESSGLASLEALFHGEKLEAGASSLNQDKLINILVRGGWPENLSTATEDAGIVPKHYIDSLLSGNSKSTEYTKFEPQIMRQVLAALARINTTTAADSRIVADVQARYGSIARQTVAKYLLELEKIFAVELIPQWFPELRSTIRLRKSPKRILTDPSLAVAALRAIPGELKRDPRTLGMLFENLCLRDLAIYADAIDATLTHYHDDSGLEVDAILEHDNTWAALEIKLGLHRVDEASINLIRLKDKLMNRGAKAPSFLAIITGAGALHTTADGIHIIPIDCLKP